MSDFAAHRSIQYSSAQHQARTALAGMWLFLGTELLFFGGLFLTFAFCRLEHPRGFALAAQQTDLTIGAVNTGLLVTSSAIYAAGLMLAEHRRVLLPALLAVLALGLAFLVLKGVEWGEDFDKHLFPGAGFGLHGVDAGGAQLFYVFYFVATALHGVHMLGGLALVGWLAWRGRGGAFARGWTTPVEVVGLYWSFVDCVWLILFPLIYLAGRAG